MDTTSFKWLSSRWPQWLWPLGFAAVLAGLASAPAAGVGSRASLAFLGSAALLASWTLLLAWDSQRTGQKLRLDVALRKQHWVQACAQGSVLLYWGWYWPPVYAFAPFLAAQLAFACAFDMLLSWTRRGAYSLGFGPFPVVFSISLFLWFRPEWFFLQFAMIALGLLAKEFLRWERDGRRVHIFNPSSFPLAAVSLVLLATHASGITWGAEIASTQFYPPHIYLFLFLIALPGEFFFGVASMTMPAVLGTYLFGLAYFASTGIYFFYDSYIPIAVFLGMHLLFTDPSTSPRTELGRILFGVLYGLSVVGLYQLLGSQGLPTFYDKLLPVPLLNLSVKAIDELVRRMGSRRAFVLAPIPGARNLAYLGIWVATFTAISAVGGVGDDHPGQYFPFWRQACMDGRSYACPYLADLDESACNRGSGWACNEAGLMDIALAQSGEDSRRVDGTQAAQPLRRGCDLGFSTACTNLLKLASRSAAFAAAPPGLADLPIVLRGSKGEITEHGPTKLTAMACHQGWPNMCAR